MSVKSKVKRLNREVERLNNEVKRLNQKNNILNNKEGIDKILLENIIKFAITNHIGGLKGGIMIEKRAIEKMKDLKLDIEESPHERACIMRVMY